MLRGNLDAASIGSVSGWAQNETHPEAPVTLIVSVDDQFVGRVVADKYREDLAQAGIGIGKHAFELSFSSPSPTDRWQVVRVVDEADGQDISGSPAIIEAGPAQGPAGRASQDATSPPQSVLVGNLDVLDYDQVRGWVHDPLRPDEPVSLIVTDNGRFAGRILANQFRQDLKEAGIGSGRHAFTLPFLPSLPPGESHEIRVFNEIDGLDIPQSPALIGPSRALGSAEKEHIARLLSVPDRPDEIAAAFAFLSDEAERLRQRYADRIGRGVERDHVRDLQRRGRLYGLVDDGPAGLRAALVIDDRTPRRARDAGSNALLSHMAALQRLRYDVAFAAAEEFGSTDVSGDDDLESLGVTQCRAPLYGSVEDVLRRHASAYDVVYLHRISNAAKYLALARHYMPRVRLVYSVADLHHVRIARQAGMEERIDLVALSKRVRLQEFAAAALSDIVITHSTFEAELLRKEVRSANVHVIPWAVAPGPAGRTFSERSGIAFIGGFAHRPNRDAALRLITEIMPRVRQARPEVECLLVGSDMPEELKEACSNGVKPVGHVEDLADVYGRVRLTVAPLSYGAGLKGKVLESLAAGVPCVCTPIAAEGLDLPEALLRYVSESSGQFADSIIRLHDSPALHEECRAAGLDFVRARFSEAHIDRLLGQALGDGPAAAGGGAG